MKLPSEVYCWLRGLKLLQSSDFQALSDTQTIDERDEKEIYYGITVLRLIDRICTIKKVEYLKLSITASVPVFSKPKMIMNWRSAFNLLPKLGLGMDSEQLSLIMTGDVDMMIDVIECMYKKFGKKVDLQEQDEMETLKVLGLSETKQAVGQQEDSRNQSAKQPNKEDSSSALVPIGMNRAKSSMLLRGNTTNRNTFRNDSMYLKPNLPTLNSSTMTRNFTLAGSKLNLTDFNLSISTQLIPLNVQQIEQTNKRPQDINHLFEYLLVTCADALKMRVTNVIPLFAGGGKILANLIVKGVRYDGFKNMIEWFSVMMRDVNHIFEMILMDDSWTTLKMFLNTIKPGLISKNQEVADLSVQLFTRIMVLLKEKRKLAAA